MTASMPEKPERALRDFLPSAFDDEEESVARAGAPLSPGQTVASEEAVIDALRTVFDPEIPVNIYDLGLVYRLDVGATGDVGIDMTLTAPACPVAGELPSQVAMAVAATPGAGVVEVRLVWDPPWTKDRMSEDARLALGLF